MSAIAAGEVVERPASVVKELVENALDAGASSVAVCYDDQGDHSISVTDDGYGIASDELELAVTRHATSKIRALSDLSTIGSFGFRGEALASIASVSVCEIVTRTRDEDSGARVRVDSGDLVERSAAAARPGTRVDVSGLFAAVPARKKFLKSASSEYAAVADTLRRFALAAPRVAFSLSRRGRKLFDFPAVAGLTERLRQVYGAELGAAMVAVDAHYRGLSLRGALSPAGTGFGSAKRISIFVNGRWVQERSLFRALMEGYRTYLVKGRYPAAVLFLEIDPAVVDVNVHPAKLEVRFSDEQLVRSFFIEAVGDTLRGAASPLGRWGLGERDLLESEARMRPSALRPDGPPLRDGAPVAPILDVPSGYQPPAPDSVGDAAASRVAEGYSGELLEPGLAERLEVLGQVLDGYIICQKGERMIIVDQHAAHERVLFERLMDAYDSGRASSQPLLLASTVSVGAPGAEAVGRHREELERMGWEIDAFGDEDVVVRALPAVVAGSDVSVLVEKLVADLLGADAVAAGRRLAEKVYASVACHAAVRVGTALTREAAESLLAEIDTVDFAASCPHGRPVASVLGRDRIERMFGR